MSDPTPSEFDEMVLNACDTRFSRVMLMNIHNDDQRRRWYLDAEADDQRATDALTVVEQR